MKNNYKSKREFKKISTPSTSSGTVFFTNTDKNFNEINQYSNIIIPKGKTVININNNYFEQIASSSLPMGYYINQNQKSKINLNNNINNTISNSNFRKTNENYSNKNSKYTNFLTEKNSLQLKEFRNILNNNKDELLIKKIINKKCHYKQISQDYIYQKNKKNENNTFNKNEKGISNESRKTFLKIETLSPQPTIGNVNIYQTEIKRKQQTKNSNKEKNKYKNFFTENNNQNKITGDLKGKEEDKGNNKEREKILLHIRDIIEYNKKENNNKNLITKKNKYKIKNEIENNNFSKYKTISNFNQENQNPNLIIKDSKHIEDKCFSNKKIKSKIFENLISKNEIKRINKEISNKENKSYNSKEERNKKAKIKNKYGFKKLPVEQKKNKTKEILRNNNINKNNTCSILNKEKKAITQKTNNNNFKNKNLLTIQSRDNTSLKNTNINKQLENNNKLLNKKFNQTIKINKNEVQFPLEKGLTGVGQSFLYKNTNSSLTKLLKFKKQENECISKCNTTTKIYFKEKIKNIKYKKDYLNLDIYPNSTCYNNLYNYYNENFKNKIYFTDKNSLNINNNNNNNNNNNKVLTITHKINNSEIRNKYKSFLLKKYKQKSCEIENKSSIQQKKSNDLLKRMNIIKQNNKNNFYQTYKQNKEKLLYIKSYMGNNIESFDNLSNSNNNMQMYSIGNIQNYTRNSLYIDNFAFQTPLIENKKLRIFKNINKSKIKLDNTDKRLGNKKGKDFDTPNTIKVNRAKFLKKVKDKNSDNNKMNTMINFNSCFSK